MTFDEPEPLYNWDHAAKRYSGRRDSALGDYLQREFTEAMNQETEQMQRMIERMLVWPEIVGIIIVNERRSEGHLYDGTYRLIHDRHLILSPHVPFGNIIEFRSVEDYEAWQENGHPILADLPVMLTDGEDGPLYP